MSAAGEGRPSTSAGPVLSSEIVGTLVRLTLLVRLIALAFGVLGLANAEDRVVTLAVMGVLALTSHLGLQRPAVRRLVVQHPAIALPDVVIVSLTPLLVGRDHPLSLVAVGTVLLVGVLFTLRTAAPLVAVLVTPHVLVAGSDTGWQVVETLGFPVILLTVFAMSAAIRRLAERQHAAELESARARSATAAAQERLRLARELHDTVAKSVQGVALTAAALHRWIERDPQTAVQHAGLVATGAREALAAARGLLTSLRLDDPERPLAAVLTELARRWEAEHGSTVLLALDEVEPLPLDQRHELVSAVSEALENAARHAPGATIRLRLCRLAGEVVVTVVDDGPGFDPEREAEAVRTGHYGLTGMRERLSSVGGRAEVRSTPGRGTVVRLVLPAEGTPAARPGADAGQATAYPAPAQRRPPPAAVRDVALGRRAS